MKILLISLPRTGSHSLMNKLATENNLKIYSEPFHVRNRKFHKNASWENENNFILKTIINQVPKDGIDNINFYCEFSKNFDKIILLSRKDLVSCTESLSYLLYNRDLGFTHDRKYNWKPTPNYNDTKIYIEKCNSDLNTLSEILSIDIIYYEDLYDLNSKNRLRLEDKDKNII